MGNGDNFSVILVKQNYASHIWNKLLSNLQRRTDKITREEAARRWTTIHDEKIQENNSSHKTQLTSHTRVVILLFAWWRMVILHNNRCSTFVPWCTQVRNYQLLYSAPQTAISISLTTTEVSLLARFGTFNLFSFSLSFLFSFLYGRVKC